MCIRDSISEGRSQAANLAPITLEEVKVTARRREEKLQSVCLLYTSDAADERSSVDLGGRRIIKKKKQT